MPLILTFLLHPCCLCCVLANPKPSCWKQAFAQDNAGRHPDLLHQAASRIHAVANPENSPFGSCPFFPPPRCPATIGPSAPVPAPVHPCTHICACAGAAGEPPGAERVASRQQRPGGCGAGRRVLRESDPRREAGREAGRRGSAQRHRECDRAGSGNRKGDWDSWRRATDTRAAAYSFCWCANTRDSPWNVRAPLIRHLKESLRRHREPDCDRSCYASRHHRLFSLFSRSSSVCP